MRRMILALTLVLVAAACGGDEGETTAPSQFPTGSVRSWFDALEANDIAGALELTYERSMLVIVGAENDLPSSDLAALLRRGATPESAEAYLADFATALRERYSSSLADVAVDGFSQIGDSFAAVTVTGDGQATIITRRNEDGVWQIDLVGTLGPALIGQVRSLLDNAEDDEDGATIRQTFEMEIIPSLEAVTAHDPANLTLASELRVLKSELGL
ncbi:MAG: hypothetical protein HKN91_10895 [Acidimicrobiia bacterium]|nr:hypothetical protein [Acidimicrobiia bacterium]